MFKSIGIRTLSSNQMEAAAKRFDKKCKTMKPAKTTGQDLIKAIRAVN